MKQPILSYRMPRVTGLPSSLSRTSAEYCLESTQQAIQCCVGWFSQISGHKFPPFGARRQNGAGGGAPDHSFGLRAFGGAYWALATAHSDPLWVRTCFGCVKEPLDDLSCLTTPGSAVPEMGCCPSR